MILTINIDLNKLPDNDAERRLALMDIFHQLARDAVTHERQSNEPSEVIPILRPGKVRVGEWEIHYDEGIDS